MTTKILSSVKHWRTIDETSELASAYTDEAGFWRLPQTSEAAREEAFDTDRRELERLGKLKTAMGLWPEEGVLHLYSPSALILGKLDRRLPNEARALAWLESEAVPTVLRIAGGQAIVSDSGVLNLSILFAEPDERLAIDDGFRLMADFIAAAWQYYLEQLTGRLWPELGLRIGEIPRSYCPGDYDMSIGGKKVVGIAQRRVKQAIGLMAYVSVEGDQVARCKLVRDFYDQGEADARFPASDPTVMTTLQDAVSDVPELRGRVTYEGFREAVLSMVRAQSIEARRSV